MRSERIFTFLSEPLLSLFVVQQVTPESFLLAFFLLCGQVRSPFHTCAAHSQHHVVCRFTTFWRKWWWEGWSWRPTWMKSSHRWMPRTRWRNLRYVPPPAPPARCMYKFILCPFSEVWYIVCRHACMLHHACYSPVAVWMLPSYYWVFVFFIPAAAVL